MKKFYVIFLFIITQPILFANDILQRQLAQLEVSLSILSDQLSFFSEKTLIDLIDQIDLFEDDIDSFVKMIGDYFLKQKTEDEVINVIKQEWFSKVEKLSRLVNLLPRIAQKGEKEKKISLYLLNYLKEYLFYILIEEKALGVFVAYRYPSEDKLGLIEKLSSAKDLNLGELYKKFSDLKKNFNDEFNLPKSLILLEFEIDLTQGVQNIKTESLEKSKSALTRIYPDEILQLSESVLEKKIKDFAEKRYKKLKYDFETIQQDDEIVSFIVYLFTTSLGEGVVKYYEDVLKNIAPELEKIRKGVYENINKIKKTIEEQPQQ